MPIGSFLRQAAYAVKYREVNFLLSDAVGKESRLIDHRAPLERLKRVAPWLTLDGNPYPSIVNGRVVWIVDGYTTSANYPYSQMTDLGSATKDSTTVSSATVSSLGSQKVNYIRNSVKATVDAYDGISVPLCLGRGRPGAADVDAGLPGDGPADQQPSPER